MRHDASVSGGPFKAAGGSSLVSHRACQRSAIVLPFEKTLSLTLTHADWSGLA
jgi:hypothetical protein